MSDEVAGAAAGPSEDIAIVGMAGRFSRAADLEALWRNLRDGVECISFFTDAELRAAGTDEGRLADPLYVKAQASLDDIDLFDAGFFGFNPREAEITNPQHRLLLECSWQALEDAACDPATFRGAIGVFVSGGSNTYFNDIWANPEVRRRTSLFQMQIANGQDFLPTLISYKLNLRGPSINVQTACSSSLVGVHLACQSLLNRECDLALAGGVAVRQLFKHGYFHAEGGIFSPDGHCRPFDLAAQGTISGDGVGMVALKRWEDALSHGDPVHAVIKGSAVNNDGWAKVGFAAPSLEGQARVISEALSIAGVDPATLGYVEAHGTGTRLGDPIEISALTEAFRSRTKARGFCAVGSVKSNLGHLDAAAGIAGLIKTVLALEHRAIPPTLHFRQANPEIDFASGPFYVNSELGTWPARATPRRAAVSSFGIGGTNAHVVLEEAPLFVPGPSRAWQLLVWSGRAKPVLGELAARLSRCLAAGAADAAGAGVDQGAGLDIGDVAHTLQQGRRAFSHRRAVVCQGLDDGGRALADTSGERLIHLDEEARTRPVAFLFPGQGAQRVGMAAEIYRGEAVFRAEVDRAAELLRPHLGGDLREVLYPAAALEETAARLRLEDTGWAQPAMFVVDYALARLWMAWGIRPQAMLGHSLGEYVAACLSGVLQLEDALALVAARGRLMRQLPAGGMLSVPLGEAEVAPLLGAELALAAINGPQRTVVSGPFPAVAALEARLAGLRVPCRRLRTSHAFHSPMTEPILPAFAGELRGVALAAPRIPYLSCLTGDWIRPEEATDPSYWVRQLRGTVRFAEAAKRLLRQEDRVFLEVGPQAMLGPLVKRHPDWHAGHVSITSLRRLGHTASETAALLDALGRLWAAGVEVDWPSFSSGERHRSVSLPTSPFVRHRHWIERLRQVDPLAGAPHEEPAEEGAAPRREAEASEPAAEVPTVPAMPPAPAARPAPAVPSALPAVPAVPAAPPAAPAGAGSALQRVVVQQLALMARQLELLATRGSRPLVAGAPAAAALANAGPADGAPAPPAVGPAVAAAALAAPRAAPALPAVGRVALGRVLPERPLAPAPAARTMEFSLYYFGNYEAAFDPGKYEMLIAGAKFADTHGLSAIWLPERHFHSFGGLSPNPAVLAAALARETSRVHLRAGSVVMPLHHPVRVAEEWSLVDNLSRGRAGVSFASGWHANDFTLAPDAYDRRHEVMYEGIEAVRTLWRGGSLRLRDGAGTDLDVRLYPLPEQAEIPVWLTAASPETCVRAGEMGVGVLTNLQTQSLPELADKLALYYEALARCGHDPARARVTLLLHTFLGPDRAAAREQAAGPLQRYLRSSFALVRRLVESRRRDIDFDRLAPEDLDYLLRSAYERYSAEHALIGSPQSCSPVVERLLAIGVTEVGCLIDFGIDTATVLAGLPYIEQLKASCVPADEKILTMRS